MRKDIAAKECKKLLHIIANEIKPQLLEKTFASVQEFDNFLISIDGTVNKKKLGANTTLALSLAFAKALAAAQKLNLYSAIRLWYNCKNTNTNCMLPMMNLINGGKHASNILELQEFMIIPHIQENKGDFDQNFKCSITEQLEVAHEIIVALAQELKNKGYSTNIGDEGGFAPNIQTSDEAFIIIRNSYKKNRV